MDYDNFFYFFFKVRVVNKNIYLIYGFFANQKYNGQTFTNSIWNNYIFKTSVSCTIIESILVKVFEYVL